MLKIYNCLLRLNNWLVCALRNEVLKALKKKEQDACNLNNLYNRVVEQKKDDKIKTIECSVRDVYQLIEDNRTIKRSFHELNTTSRPSAFPFFRFFVFAVLLLVLIVSPFLFGFDSNGSLSFSSVPK